MLETARSLVEQLTGVGRPERRDLAGLLRMRNALEFRFKSHGLVPNHPSWPLIVYRSPVRLPENLDPAAVFEELFAANGWGDSWRNGIYSYVHYHSRIHEVLGIARGSAVVRFGGTGGRKLHLKAGDVAVLPAGTGHQRLSSSKDFLVVGAYPQAGTYDECRAVPEDFAKAEKTIPRVKAPRSDPVYGRERGLPALWVE